MDNARLQQLARHNLAEGFIPVGKFVDRFETERVKLLWQWATAKQMSFDEWKTYLEAHVAEVARMNAMDESVSTETKE